MSNAPISSLCSMRAILLKLLLVFSVVEGSTCRVTAQLAAWNVSGINSTSTNPFSATTLGSLISSASLTLGSGVTASSSADTFGGSGFNTTTLANAISGNDYISFTTTPSSGSQFSASSLILTFGVATAANFNLALMTSATGFTSGNELWTFSFATSSPAAQTITLSSISNLQNQTSSVEFRIYGYRDTSGTTTFRIRDLAANGGHDLQLGGSASAIPEPSTYAAIFGVVALSGAFWKRLRKFDTA